MKTKFLLVPLLLVGCTGQSVRSDYSWPPGKSNEGKEGLVDQATDAGTVPEGKRQFKAAFEKAHIPPSPGQLENHASNEGWHGEL